VLQDWLDPQSCLGNRESFLTLGDVAVTPSHHMHKSVIEAFKKKLLLARINAGVSTSEEKVYADFCEEFAKSLPDSYKSRVLLEPESAVAPAESLQSDDPSTGADPSLATSNHASPSASVSDALDRTTRDSSTHACPAVLPFGSTTRGSASKADNGEAKATSAGVKTIIASTHILPSASTVWDKLSLCCSTYGATIAK
jgi:hypothetical protein